MARKKIEKPVENQPPEQEVKKPKLSYISISVGRDETTKRWACILDHIEDGTVVKREVLCSNSAKTTALDKCKIALVRRMLREEHRVL